MSGNKEAYASETKIVYEVLAEFTANDSESENKLRNKTLIESDPFDESLPLNKGENISSLLLQAKLWERILKEHFIQKSKEAKRIIHIAFLCEELCLQNHRGEEHCDRVMNYFGRLNLVLPCRRGEPQFPELGKTRISISQLGQDICTPIKIILLSTEKLCSCTSNDRIKLIQIHLKQLAPKDYYQVYLWARPVNSPCTFVQVSKLT